jgi:hypothetical protein
VNLASRGLRDLDDGNGKQKIDDAAELAQVRRQARKVYVKSFALAAVMLALITAAPVNS